MRLVPLLSLLLFCLLPISSKAAEVSDYRAYLISTEPPSYPELARATHMEGVGKYLAKINPETGAISKVTVQQSTGFKLLDDAALGAIRRWRVKPHTLTEMIVPMNFQMAGQVADQLRAARAHATYAPAPVYPFSLWRYGISSGGRYRLTIDPNSGRVTDVNIVDSSRVLALDQSCLNTFRRWRFTPHTVETQVISYSFY